MNERFPQGSPDWTKAETYKEKDTDGFMKVQAHEDINASLSRGIETFLSKRDEWVGKGVLTAEEINGSDEVKEFAAQQLERAKLIGDSAYEEMRAKLAEEGLIAEAEPA